VWRRVRRVGGRQPRLVEELPDPQPPELTQYNRHCYQCHSCGTETVASHPDCPDEGQFGVNVIAKPLFPDTITASPTGRSPTGSSNCMASNSQVHPRGIATERAARAGRCEYEQIRRRIQHADVVHIDETGIKRDGEQAWMWTFRTESTRCTRSERVAEAMFP